MFLVASCGLYNAIAHMLEITAATSKGPHYIYNRVLAGGAGSASPKYRAAVQVNTGVINNAEKHPHPLDLKECA